MCPPKTSQVIWAAAEHPRSSSEHRRSAKRECANSWRDPALQVPRASSPKSQVCLPEVTLTFYSASQTRWPVPRGLFRHICGKNRTHRRRTWRGKSTCVDWPSLERCVKFSAPPSASSSPLLHLSVWNAYRKRFAPLILPLKFAISPVYSADTRISVEILPYPSSDPHNLI